MSVSGEITPRQRRVLERLLKGETVTDAAQREGVSARQVFRWLRADPEFRATLREAQSVLLDGVGVQLVTLANRAVGVLAELIDSYPARGDVPGAAVRRRAARDVLDCALRWKELLDFEQRLSALEEALTRGKS